MYQIMLFGGISLAVVMLFVSILLFVKYNIVKVVGDISGSTARKAINEIRKQNEQTGDKHYISSQLTSDIKIKSSKATSSDLSIKTDKISKSEKISKKLTNKEVQQPQYQTSPATELLQPTVGTELLQQVVETDIDCQNKTTQLDITLVKTEVLTDVYSPPVNYNFEIEYEIILINTNEYI